jgi:hypothetical protein
MSEVETDLSRADWFEETVRLGGELVGKAERILTDDLYSGITEGWMSPFEIMVAVGDVPHEWIRQAWHNEPEFDSMEVFEFIWNNVRYFSGVVDQVDAAYPVERADVIQMIDTCLFVHVMVRDIDEANRPFAYLVACAGANGDEVLYWERENVNVYQVLLLMRQGFSISQASKMAANSIDSELMGTLLDGKTS